MPQPEEMMQYSKMLNELVLDYPEYKDMTISEISDSLAEDDEMAIDDEQDLDIPAMPEEDMMLEDEEEEDYLM